MTIGNIIERLPRIVPDGIINEEDENTFEVIEFQDGSSSRKTFYQIEKAPVRSVERVTGVVDGSSYTFVIDTDYEVVDDDGDGSVDAIRFIDDPTSTWPDDGSTFTIAYECESIISRYLESYSEDTSTIETKVDDAIASRQVDNASGKDLDRIGALFGELGARRGRSDTEYRILLKSIVQSFAGRGTKPGMKFAIATGVGTDIDNVVINEDFQQVGYSIEINDVDTEFLTDVIIDLAEIADPSGVELLANPFINAGGTTHIIQHTEASVTSTSSGLGSGTLTLDGNSTLQ